MSDNDVVPLLFTAEGQFRNMRARRLTPSVEYLGVALGRVGRNEEPWLLALLHADHRLTVQAARRYVGDAWNGAEYPDARCLDHGLWRGLFTHAGYTVNGEAAERPREPLRLFRGSVPHRRRDWSWTDSLEVATGYAMGTRARRPLGLVWTAKVQPWRLLARHIGSDYRDEQEYVVDTRGLAISPADSHAEWPLAL